MPQQKIYLQWNYDSIIWGFNDYIWSEVYILINIGTSFGGGGGGLVLPNKNPWKDVEKQFKEKEFTEEDTKKFLEIVVRVNGLVKTEVRDTNKVKKMITVEHIKNTLAEFIPSIKVTAVDIKKK
jgi:hypothetical protein